MFSPWPLFIDFLPPLGLSALRALSGTPDLHRLRRYRRVVGAQPVHRMGSGTEGSTEAELPPPRVQRTYLDLGRGR